MEIPRSVQRLVQRKADLIQEAIDRVQNAKISKFDRIQLRRALESDDDEKIDKIQSEISQKLIGPDFKAKSLRTEFSLIRDLKDLGFEKFVIYYNLVQPLHGNLTAATLERTSRILHEVSDDPDLDKYGS